MYINFSYLYTKGYTIDDFIFLIAVKQQDVIVLDLLSDRVDLDSLEAKGLISYVKGNQPKLERVRISKTGVAIIDYTTTIEYTESLANFAQKIQDLYREYEVDSSKLGSSTQIMSDAKWFISNTIFSLRDIYHGIEEYIQSEISKAVSKGQEPTLYIIGLGNIFWKPRKNVVFATHPKLSESKLYSILCEQHFEKTGEDLQNLSVPNTSKEKKEFEYINILSKLNIPPSMSPSMYFTGSKKGDKEKKSEIIAQYLTNNLK